MIQVPRALRPGGSDPFGVTWRIDRTWWSNGNVRAADKRTVWSTGSRQCCLHHHLAAVTGNDTVVIASEHTVR
jgi:hypothetical protein